MCAYSAEIVRQGHDLGSGVFKCEINASPVHHIGDEEEWNNRIERFTFFFLNLSFFYERKSKS